MQWQKALGGSYGDRAYAVAVCADGAIMVAGDTNSNNGDIVSRVGTVDVLLIKRK